MTTATATRVPRIHRGKKPAPDRILLYGSEGVGKTTFAANAPSPIFLAAEDGIRMLDVASFEDVHDIATVHSHLDWLATADHEFKTLVVDTLDWLEPMVWDHTCKVNGWQDIEAPGYGKGYTAATEVWRDLLARFDRIRNQRGMEIILLAHSSIKNFANPGGSDYSRYEMKLSKAAGALVREWCDSNLFAIHDDVVRKEKTGRAKAGGSNRVMKTTRSALFDAKNRYELPEELPFDLDAYHNYAAARDASMRGAEVAHSSALAALAALPADHPARAAAAAAIEEAKNDSTRLTRMANRLAVLAAEATPGEQQ